MGVGLQVEANILLVGLTVAARPHGVAHDDESLLAAVAAGDELALGQLYDRFGPQVYAIALRVTGLPAAAEEVVSDTFLRVWHSARSFARERGEVGSWITTIARNRSLDERRRRAARVGEAELHDSHVAPDPDDSAARLDVHNALAALPDDERAVLELAYYDGLSQREIAARLGLSLGLVKSLTRRGLEKLRRGGALEP